MAFFRKMWIIKDGNYGVITQAFIIWRPNMVAAQIFQSWCHQGPFCQRPWHVPIFLLLLGIGRAHLLQPSSPFYCLYWTRHADLRYLVSYSPTVLERGTSIIHSWQMKTEDQEKHIMSIIWLIIGRGRIQNQAWLTWKLSIFCSTLNYFYYWVCPVPSAGARTGNRHNCTPKPVSWTLILSLALSKHL